MNAKDKLVLEQTHKELLEIRMIKYKLNYYLKGLSISCGEALSTSGIKGPTTALWDLINAVSTIEKEFSAYIKSDLHGQYKDCRNGKERRRKANGWIRRNEIDRRKAVCGEANWTWKMRQGDRRKGE